jgi:SAM-dependent methyltransferase
MTTYEISGCPACHSQSFRGVADQGQIARELEALWQFHLRRTRVGAPVDQFFDRTIFSQQPPLHVVACTECGTVFRNPRERDFELVETYAAEAPSQRALDSLFVAQRAFYRPRAERLTALHGGAGTVLEVGSYIGAFLSAARAGGWQGVGLDVNTHASAYARARGCVIEETTLNAYQSEARFDAVVLWNCFDQLADPHETLQRAGALLRSDGLLAVRIPNGAFYERVRRLPGGLRCELLAWNNLASFPYRHGFTAQAIKRMLAAHDFQLVALQGDVLVSIAGPWTKRWAIWEERTLKVLLKRLLRGAGAPWLEVYARRSSH